MNFHLGKIYKFPNNLYFYKANQPRLLMEYCKKIKIPQNIHHIKPIRILENNSSCIEYCKNIIIFPENDEITKMENENENDDESWVDMKKFL